jgi:hypothetical protein
MCFKDENIVKLHSVIRSLFFITESWIITFENEEWVRMDGLTFQ